MTDRFVPARLANFRPRDMGGGARVRLEALAKGLTDVISLNSGDPDLPAAPVAIDAAIEALRSGRTQYAIGGLPALRAAIARKLAQENGIRVDSDKQVIITNGAAEALAAVFQTILEPGDEVLTTNPAYNGHVTTITAARGVPVFVPTQGDHLWEPDPNDVEQRITPRTKAFIFASPGNPTAAVYQRKTLEDLVDIAARRDILLVSDELFERFVFDGRHHVSPASLPGAIDRVVTINGFSKSYCMTGWRVGWIAAPLWLADPLSQVRYSLSMCSATPNQWGALAALSESAREYYDGVYQVFSERRAFFLAALHRAGLLQEPAPGGFVTMIDIRSTGKTATDVAEAFLNDARVLAWPGTAFGSQGEGYLRVGLVVPIDVLRTAVERLVPVVSNLLASAVHS